MKSLTTKAALAALALTILGTLPSFAWGFHPRQNEVLKRDNYLRRETNNQRGDLGGHYNQLRREESAIRNQERRDFRRDGGRLTAGQERRLNREENHVQRQINRDERRY